MEEQTVDEKELWSSLEEVLREAARRFVDTRIKEGGHLKNDILEKLDGMYSKVEQVGRVLLRFSVNTEKSWRIRWQNFCRIPR